MAPHEPTNLEYQCVEPPEPDTPATPVADSAQTPSVPDSELARCSARLAAGSQNASNNSGKRTNWGRNADFKHDEKNDSCKLTIDDVDLELHTSHKDRVTHYGLKGHATNVFPLTSEKLAKDNPEIAKDGMVAKVLWVKEQRTSEPDILKKVYGIAGEQDAVKGHVPHLQWHHKFKEPTSQIREALGISEPARGSRVLYILVFRKLQPIMELKGTEFFDAWRQCI
ncbi:hypothetical protein AZE42_07280, partial [Rhizopogon vesiculosus]